MTDTIEEVMARAMAGKDGKSDRYWRDYHDLARVAIEALREAGYVIRPKTDGDNLRKRQIGFDATGIAFWGYSPPALKE